MCYWGIKCYQLTYTANNEMLSSSTHLNYFRNVEVEFISCRDQLNHWSLSWSEPLTSYLIDTNKFYHFYKHSFWNAKVNTYEKDVVPYDSTPLRHVRFSKVDFNNRNMQMITLTRKWLCISE